MLSGENNLIEEEVSETELRNRSACQVPESSHCWWIQFFYQTHLSLNVWTGWCFICNVVWREILNLINFIRILLGLLLLRNLSDIFTSTLFSVYSVEGEAFLSHNHYRTFFFFNIFQIVRKFVLWHRAWYSTPWVDRVTGLAQRPNSSSLSILRFKPLTFWARFQSLENLVYLVLALQNINNLSISLTDWPIG